jgi:hypothetical protein
LIAVFLEYTKPPPTKSSRFDEKTVRLKGFINSMRRRFLRMLAWTLAPLRASAPDWKLAEMFPTIQTCFLTFALPL